MGSKIRTTSAPSSAPRTPPALAAVLIPDRRAAGLTETVAKAASGALEHLPVVRIGNVTQTLESLKAKGFWIYGLDERAPISTAKPITPGPR